MSTLPLERRERWIDTALWLVTGAAVLLTVVLSFVGEPPGGNAFAGVDKVQHGVAYFAMTLGLLLVGVWRPVRGRGPLWSVRWWLPVAILAAGAAIEVLQTAVPPRQGDVLDWLAEALGVGLALVTVGVLYRRAEG